MSCQSSESLQSVLLFLIWNGVFKSIRKQSILYCDFFLSQTGNEMVRDLFHVFLNSIKVIVLFLIWAPSSEFVSSSIPSWQILTAHAQPFRGARDLAFCLKVPLDSLLVWASSEGSGETARMRRLAWTFTARIGDKYQIRLTRSIYKPGLKVLLDIMLYACVLNTWAVSRPLKTGIIVLDLTMLRHPHPDFGIKENYLFCIWKLVVRIWK